MNDDKTVLVKIIPGGESFEAGKGENLLDVLRQNNVPITAVCNGRGSCGKCLVSIDGAKPVLACKTLVESNIEVEVVGSDEGFEILGAYNSDSGDAGTGGGDFSIAVDIGTTTVVTQLINLSTGKAARSCSSVNSQRRFGADVISRIQSADEGNLKQLSALITSQISQHIKEVCADIPPENIKGIFIAGNTTMIYLLLCEDCRSLGQFPFDTHLVLQDTYKYSDIFKDGSLDCGVMIWPWISAFVGGDITAGIAYCKAQKPDAGVWILIDMGTNGEMVLYNKGKYLCTSTAAGPAFEGGNIKFGTGSVMGAINAVSYEGGKIEIDTIGKKPPVGICGSGLLDALACLVKADVIDETGLFDDEYFDDGFVIAKKQDGTAIFVTQKDIREMQLAKSAIRAGIEILMKEAGLTCEDIDTVYLSGGFGQNLNVNSAVQIGILPSALESKVIACGNSSLGGCALGCKSPELLQDALSLAKNTQEMNLSAHPDFNNLFMECMTFEKS